MAEPGSRPVCTRWWGFNISTEEADPGEMGCLGYRLGYGVPEAQSYLGPGQGHWALGHGGGLGSLPLCTWRTSMSGVQEAPAIVGKTAVPLSPPFPTVSKRRRHWAVPSPQHILRLRVGVSGVVVRAARDKGRLSDARSDPGCCFPDAGPTADSRPGQPQGPPPAAPGRAAPGGRKWGGARGGAESTFPLKPRRNVGGFPETRPWPPAGPPAPHLDLLPREPQEGLGGSPGGSGSSPPSALAPSGLMERKGG